MKPLWHILVVIAIFYVGWRAWINAPPTLEEHLKARLQYVNAGMFWTISLLIFIFVLSATGHPLGVVIPVTCFFTWVITLVVMLESSYHFSLFARRSCRVLIISVPIIVLLYSGGPKQFLNDVDQFAGFVIYNTNVRDEEPKSPEQKVSQSTSKDVNESSGDQGQASRPQFRLSYILKAFFLFIQAFLLSTYYGKMWLFRREDKIRRKTSKAMGMADMDQAVYVLSLAFSIWFSFVLLGFDTLSVSIFSGLIALGVSVALRDLLSNFVAGLLLLWDKSIKMHDVIAIDKQRSGEVRKITMRYMIVQDRNDIEYLVPHTQLINATVENWTRENRQVRLKLDVGVAYGSPIDKVQEIMKSVCFDVPRVLKNPLPNPLILSLDDSAIHFQLRFRIADPENGIRNVMSDVYQRLLQRFKEAEIEIPYPQHEVTIRSSSAPESAVSSVSAA